LKSAPFGFCLGLFCRGREIHQFSPGKLIVTGANASRRTGCGGSLQRLPDLLISRLKDEYFASTQGFLKAWCNLRPGPILGGGERTPSLCEGVFGMVMSLRQTMHLKRQLRELALLLVGLEFELK
jgi:hypothetical protein